MRAVVFAKAFWYPMLSEDIFPVVDDGTGRSVGKLPDNWKLAVFVGYQ